MARAQSYEKKKKDTAYLKHYAKCLHPRIGEKYQVQIPTLLSPSDPYRISREGSVVRGSPSAPWICLDYVSFLVAIYIFGKNFFLMRKFLSGWAMGDIQSFYYGRFYNSDEYKRWKKCPKSKKGRTPLTISGTKRIFLGLHPQVPQKIRKAAKEAHEECEGTECEGTASLLNYALLMKNMVGPEALFEGIQRYTDYLDVDEERTSRTTTKKKSNDCKHAKRGVDPPTVPAKRQKSTKPESEQIKDKDVDQERKNESSNLVSESSNGRRRSQRSRVMSTKAVEAFETYNI